jgi:hypothetical protein
MVGNDSTAEYDDFLQDLQSVVAERVEEIRARQSAQTPRAFQDDEKVVRDWPELSGRVVEEPR